MEGKEDWLEVFQETVKIMKEIANDLKSISNRLSWTLSECQAVSDLCLLSSDLRLQSEKLKEAIDSNLSESLKQARESSGNVLRACLAGVFVAPGTTEEQKKALKPIIES